MNWFLSSSFYSPSLLPSRRRFCLHSHECQAQHSSSTHIPEDAGSSEEFYFIPNIQLCNIFICGFFPPQNMFFKQAKLRPTLWPQSEAVSLGFCKEQNTLKTIRMKTIHTLLVTPELPRQWKCSDGARSVSREFQPWPNGGWPTSIIPQPPVSVGWVLSLQPQAGAREGGWEKTYTCPPPFPVPIEVPKILSLSPKLYETSPSWWILGTFLFAVLCLQLS